MQTFGAVHSRLIMQLVIADRPYRYITIITRVKELKTLCNTKKLGAKVLLILTQAWKIKSKYLRSEISLPQQFMKKYKMKVNGSISVWQKMLIMLSLLHQSPLNK
jgi:hypothetical protein